MEMGESQLYTFFMFTPVLFPKLSNSHFIKAVGI